MSIRDTKPEREREKTAAYPFECPFVIAFCLLGIKFPIEERDVEQGWMVSRDRREGYVSGSPSVEQKNLNNTFALEFKISAVSSK